MKEHCLDPQLSSHWRVSEVLRIFSWGRNSLKYTGLDMNPVNWLTLDIMSYYLFYQFYLNL